MKNLILLISGLLLCCINGAAERSYEIPTKYTYFTDSTTLHELIYNADGTRDLYFLDDTIDVNLIIIYYNEDCVVTNTPDLKNFDFKNYWKNKNQNVFLFDRWGVISAFLNGIRKKDEWLKWVKNLPQPQERHDLDLYLPENIKNELEDSIYIKIHSRFGGRPYLSLMEYAENKKPAFYTSVIIKAELINYISLIYENDETEDYFKYIEDPGTFYRVVIPVWDCKGLPLKQHDSTSR